MIQKCISSWYANLEGYYIQCWNEDNLDLSHPYLASCIDQRLYAFAADFIRFKVLMMYGGIYLDTDVEVLGRFDSLLDLVSFIGCEDDRRKRPNAAVIGCVPNASFSSRMTEFYELLDQNNSIIVCDAISRVIKDGHVHDLTILPQRFFYPYNPYSSCAYQKDLPLMASEITSETVAIHHWQKSWKT